MTNKIIEINQVLYGYDLGHRLLESSLTITPDTKREMLVLSDMSGSSMIQGFEEYITGYPLNEVNMYAFAKTWYAPEMKRPGCVWTHTLLFHFSDLIKLNNHHSLLKLFKRPSKTSDFSDYKKSIKLEEENISDYFDLNSIQITSSFVKETVYNLYSNNKKSILLKAINSNQFENLIIAIWFQQWPRLRRNFSFCTGAISPRTVNNYLFDIQAIPKESNKKILTNNYILVDNDSLDYNIKDQNEWVNLLYEDLLYPSKLRYFFKQFGIDVKENRSAMIPLIELYNYFFIHNEKKSISNTLKLLSKSFPKKNEGNVLKLTLLKDYYKNNVGNIRFFNEKQILLELAITKFYKSFDYDKLDYLERFKSFYDKNFNKAIDILNQLITSELNLYGERLTGYIAKQFEPEKIVYIKDNYRSLLHTFILFNPELAYNYQLWEVSHEQQRETFHSLLKANKNNSVNWEKIISIILDLDARIDIEIIEKNITDIVSYVLDWVNNDEKDLQLNYKWKVLLGNKPKEVISWLVKNKDLTDDSLEIILDILNPNSSEVLNKDTNIWLRIFPKNKYTEEELSIKYFSFILAIAFNKHGDDLFNLLRLSFEKVYKAALKDKLRYESWKSIEIHTKPLPFWKEWDKCKKLRNLLIDTFITEDWSINKIDNIFQDDELLEKFYSKLLLSGKTRI